MFFNRLKQVSTNVFNKGRDILKKVPEFVARATEIAGQVGRFANSAAKKIEDTEKVYEKTKQYASPETQAKIGNVFKTTKMVNSQIQRTANAAEDIGQQIQPLFT